MDETEGCFSLGTLPQAMLLPATSGSLVQTVLKPRPDAELNPTSANSSRKDFIQGAGKCKYPFRQLPSLKLWKVSMYRTGQ